MSEQGEEFDLQEWIDDCMNGCVEWGAAAYEIKCLRYALDNRPTPVEAVETLKARIAELEQRLHFSHEAIRQYHRAHPSRKTLMAGPPEAKSEIDSALQEGE